MAKDALDADVSEGSTQNKLKAFRKAFIILDGLLELAEMHDSK